MNVKPVHASCIAWLGNAMLVRGDSGTGKSSLTLALVERGWTLVGDDYVVIEAHDSKLIARPSPKLVGLCEVRHVGIIRIPCRLAAPVVLVVDLVAETLPRLPEPQTIKLAGIMLPWIRFPAGQNNLTVSIEMAFCRALAIGRQNG